MNDALLGQSLAHRLVLESLIHRLRQVKGFQMMGLVQDLSELEARLDGLDIPEDVGEAASDELLHFFEIVQEARGVPPAG